jgi:hypothetical protein
MCIAVSNAATAQSKYRALELHDNYVLDLAAMQWAHVANKLAFRACERTIIAQIACLPAHA